MALKVDSLQMTDFKSILAQLAFMAVLSFAILAVLGVFSKAEAVMNAGTTTAAVFDSGINVSAPYTGDSNATGTVEIKWTLNVDTTFASPLGTQLLSDNSNPYTYSITGLSNGTAYRVRVTYIDATDGVSGTAVQTIVNLIPVNPLLHNSLSVRSTKWQIIDSGKTVNGWGIANAQYGLFSCSTCHAKGTTNIKRVKTSISAPTDTFPGGSSVVFDTVDEGANGGNGFGDDQGGHASSSRVCEVCHSITDYHRYNTTVDPDGGGPLTVQSDLGHYNNQDCSSCHKHIQGFRASCDSCHGNPPVDAGTLVSSPAPTGSTEAGAHNRHVSDVTGPQYTCDSCHGSPFGSGANHTISGVVSINFNAFGSTAGTYNGQVAVTYDGANDGAKDNSLACSSVYCHGGSIGGSSATWDGSAACGSCHGVSAASPPANPASGTSHSSHAGNGGSGIYQGADISLSCNNCHGGFGGSTHVDGDVSYNVSALASDYRNLGAPNRYAGNEIGSSGGLAPSGTYSTCSNLACHWGTTTPTWDNGPADCTTCHSGATTGSTGAPDSGQHALHVGASPDYIDGCDACHPSGSDNGTHGSHIDGNVDFLSSGTFTGADYSNGGTAGNHQADDDSCATACHLQANWGNNGPYVDGGSNPLTIDWTLQDSLSNCNSSATVATGEPVVNYCLDCHASGLGYNSGPQVTNSSFVGTHLDPKVNWVPNCTEDQMNICLECHVMHDSAVNAAALYIPIPTNPSYRTALGLNFVGAEHLDAINMRKTIPSQAGYTSGSQVTATTEAEICWGCHSSSRDASLTQKEFTGQSYQNGYTTSSYNWTAASFNPPGSLLPTRPTRSVHSANLDQSPGGGDAEADVRSSSVGSNVDGSGNLAGSPSLEKVDYIRCSYCHDVHNTHGPDKGQTISSVTTQTYLRGSWLQNPYPVERPPESGETWAGNAWSHFYNDYTVPRLRTDVATKNAGGGYQIDQNNNYPNAAFIDNADRPSEATNTAGLCTICHGSNVDSMDYYGSDSLWLLNNGHSNAALGGSGSDKSNLFDGRNRFAQLDTTPGYYMGGQGVDVPNINKWGKEASGEPMGYLPSGDGKAGGGSSGEKPDDGDSSGNTATPPRFTGYYSATGIRDTDNMPASYTAWYSATGIGSNNGPSGRAHDFSCSKCHSPHASGLPALLITNCLDYQVSDWSSTGRANEDGEFTIGPTATNRWAKEAMNNCHIKQDNGSGWNTLREDQ